MSKAIPSPRARPEPDPLTSPDKRLWALVVGAGAAILLFYPAPTTGLELWLRAAMPVAILWGIKVAPSVRPLAQRRWSGSFDAAATVLLQPRRLYLASLVAFLFLVFSSELRVRGAYDAAGVPFAELVWAVAAVLVVVPDRRDWRTAPIVIAAGVGPRYLPRGARFLVTAGVLLLVAFALWGAGLFGPVEASASTIGQMVLTPLLLKLGAPAGGRETQGAKTSEELA